VVSEGYVQAFFTNPATKLAGDLGSLAERLRKGLFLRIRHLLKRSSDYPKG
jgi:hypothetical protein